MNRRILNVEFKNNKKKPNEFDIINHKKIKAVKVVKKKKKKSTNQHKTKFTINNVIHKKCRILIGLICIPYSLFIL